MTTHLLFLSLFALSLPVVASATPQVCDALEYEGQTYQIGRWMDALPLETYFRAGNTRPKEFKAPGSLCWRGHVAFWRITSNKLWLTQVFLYDDTAEFLGLQQLPTKNYPIHRLFPEAGPAVHASWFTGDIELDRTLSRTQQVEGGQLETYEGQVLVVEKGIVTKVEKRSLTVRRHEQPPTNWTRDRLGPPPLTSAITNGVEQSVSVYSGKRTASDGKAAVEPAKTEP